MAPLLASPSQGIRTYCERLRTLGAALSDEPLSEHRTTALVDHIVNNWGNARFLRDLLRAETPVQISEFDTLYPAEKSTAPASTDDHTSLTVYCDKLRELIADLCLDPLDESRTILLLEHICNHRSYAVYLEQLINAESGSALPTESAPSMPALQGR